MPKAALVEVLESRSSSSQGPLTDSWWGFPRLSWGAPWVIVFLGCYRQLEFAATAFLPLVFPEFLKTGNPVLLHLIFCSPLRSCISLCHSCFCRLGGASSSLHYSSLQMPIRTGNLLTNFLGASQLNHGLCCSTSLAKLKISSNLTIFPPF